MNTLYIFVIFSIILVNNIIFRDLDMNLVGNFFAKINPLIPVVKLYFAFYYMFKNY